MSKTVHRFSPDDDQIIQLIFKTYFEKEGEKYCLDKLEKIFSVNGKPYHDKRSIKERRMNFLIRNATPFTKEEDNLILKLQKKIGNKWSKMVRYFNNRSARQINIRFKHLERKILSKGCYEENLNITPITPNQNIQNDQPNEENLFQIDGSDCIDFNMDESDENQFASLTDIF